MYSNSPWFSSMDIRKYERHTLSFDMITMWLYLWPIIPMCYCQVIRVQREIHMIEAQFRRIDEPLESDSRD